MDYGCQKYVKSGLNFMCLSQSEYLLGETNILELSYIYIVIYFPLVIKDPCYARSLGSKLVSAVYKGIAPGEDRKALPSLDISSRRLADGLLQLAFSLGGQVSAKVLSHFICAVVCITKISLRIFYLP